MVYVYVQIVGMPYLQDTLSPVIDLIYDEHKSVELDPNGPERKEEVVFQHHFVLYRDRAQGGTLQPEHRSL